MSCNTVRARPYSDSISITKIYLFIYLFLSTIRFMFCASFTNPPNKAAHQMEVTAVMHHLNFAPHKGDQLCAS